MKAPQLENDSVKLTLLDLTNYTQLQNIAKQKDLLFYSPSDIATADGLRNYI